MRLMQYKRNDLGRLELFINEPYNYINEENKPITLYKWVHYRQSKYYKPDAKLSSNSGFASSQNCLKLGYSFLPVED